MRWTKGEKNTHLYLDSYIKETRPRHIMAICFNSFVLLFKISEFVCHIVFKSVWLNHLKEWSSVEVIWCSDQWAIWPAFVTYGNFILEEFLGWLMLDFNWIKICWNNPAYFTHLWSWHENIAEYFQMLCN